MSNQERRSFSREFKLRVIERLEAGESGSALALELSVKRTIIYRWRDAWREGGPEALVNEGHIRLHGGSRGAGPEVVRVPFFTG
jgi:transposase-like protein